MILELASLKKAVSSLEQTVNITTDQSFSKLSGEFKNAIRAGVVQNFEFTYELCWKFMKRFLENQLGSSLVDGISRTELFRLSSEHHLIDDVAVWKNYHRYRNLTSHSYDEEVAEEISQLAREFAVQAKKLLFALESSNDKS